MSPVTVVQEILLRDLAGGRIDIVAVEVQGVRFVDLIVGDERVVLAADGLDDLIAALREVRQ